MGNEQGYFEPTLFYARNHNKNVSYDPGIGIAYSRISARPTLTAFGFPAA